MNRAWISEKARRTHPLCDPASSKVFAMLMAYMDDSGTHDGSHNCVIAGYWGGIKEWKRFEWAWRCVLDSEDVKEFHAKEFWPRIPDKGRVGLYKDCKGRKRRYRDWSDERHARFIDALLGVIETSNIVPFSCGVLGAEWSKLTPHRKAIISQAEEEKLQKAMFLPMHRIFVRLAGYCYPGRKMHFTFDEDKQNVSLGLAISSRFAMIKQGLKEGGSPLFERLGGFGFDDSEIACPLQAADLLAYESHRFAKAVERNLPMRTEYKRALTRAKSKDDFWLFDEERFATLERAFAEIDAKYEGENR